MAWLSVILRGQPCEQPRQPVNYSQVIIMRNINYLWKENTGKYYLVRGNWTNQIEKKIGKPVKIPCQNTK